MIKTLPYTVFLNKLRIVNITKLFRRNQSKSAEDPEFSPDEVIKFKQLFLKFDRDDNNLIDRWEFTNFAKWITGSNVNLTDLNKIFSRIDTSNDQFISPEELMKYFEKRFADQSKKEIVQTFKKFDKDGDGFLHYCESKDALLSLIPDVKSENLKEIYKTIDKDQDHKINLKEFVQFLCEAIKKKE